MGWAATSVRACALLALCTVAGAEGAPSRGGPLHIDGRRGSFEDPGVVRLRGARAFDVRKVWFGRKESPAIARGVGQEMTVAVPAGEVRTRVRVRAEMADGSLRSMGTFRYDDPLFPRGTRVIHAGGSTYCETGPLDDPKSLTLTTQSTVERLRDGTFAYRWTVNNPFTGTVTIQWDALRLLGLPDASTIVLGPGETFVKERIDAARPRIRAGQASVDARPGCRPGEEGGASWYDPTYLPASALPVPGPLRNVRVFPYSDTSNLVTWDDPETGPPERVLITLHYLHYNAGNPRGHHETRDFATAPDTNTKHIGYTPDGVVSVFLRPLLDGVEGEGVLIHAAH